jgi:hypothetical protein
MSRYSIALGKFPSVAEVVKDPEPQQGRIQRRARVDRYDIALGKEPPPGHRSSYLSEVVEDNLHRPASQDTELFQYLQSSPGRLQLAETMAINVRQSLNSFSLARRCLISDNLPRYGASIYDVPHHGTSSLIFAEDGINILRIENNPRRVAIPDFELRGDSVRIEMSRNFRETPGIFDKIINQASTDLVTKEGSRFISLLDSAEVTIISTVFLELSVLLDAFTEIEKNYLRVGHILINPEHNSAVRRWEGSFDRATNPEQIVAGILGTVYGVQISHSQVVPAGSVFVIAESAQLGRMPILQDVTGISVDDPYARENSLIFFESIGMGLLDTRAVARINILPF